MSTDELRRLLSDAEIALRRRRHETTDPQEKAALSSQLDELRLLQDSVDLQALMNAADILNRLADVVEGATAALRTRPFDAVLGAYQGIFDRIGAAIGHEMQLARPAALDNPPPPGPAPESGPAAATELGEGAAAIAPSAARATPATSASDAARLEALYHDARLRDDKIAEIDALYLPRLVQGRERYQQVGQRLGIPWWVIGTLHGLEASFSFETHLHNGDPLTGRTVHVPSGRPAVGEPPFSWVASALDALTGKGLGGLDDWSLGTTLDRIEQYNGLGYRLHNLPSPYLWSYTQHYEKGKFVADGQFDPNAVSRQAGAAALMLRLQQKGLIDLDAPLDAAAGSVAAARISAAVRPAGAAAAEVPGGSREADIPDFAAATVEKELAFTGRLAEGDKDRGNGRKVRRVQEWCSFHGCATTIDGDFSGGTAGAVRKFQTGKGLDPTGEVDERTWALLTAPMHRALAPVPVNARDTLYDVVVRVAETHLAVHPVEFRVRGEGNCGPWVRLYMLGKEGEEQFWCAGFVSHVIGQAAVALGVDMPLKRQVGVDELVRDAKAADRFIPEAAVATEAARRDRLRPGMLFCIRKTDKDWTHVGIVRSAAATSFATVEGNSSEEGSSNGVEVCSNTRGYPNRDFIALA